MTTDGVDPSLQPQPPAPAVQAQKNSFQRLAGALFAPVETFTDIARKPDILIPLLTILILSYVGVILSAPKMDWDAVTSQQAEMMKAKNPNMSEADLARVAKFTKAFGTAAMYVAPFIVIVALVIIAGVLLLAMRLFGGEGNFAQAFSATLYAWMPRVLGSCIGAVILMTKGKMDPSQMATLVKSNLGFLVDMKEQPVLFSFLSSFDVFGLWTLALLIVGFAILSKSSKAKTAAIVISLWIATLLVKLGFAALGAARMKA